MIIVEIEDHILNASYFHLVDLSYMLSIILQKFLTTIVSVDELMDLDNTFTLDPEEEHQLQQVSHFLKRKRTFSDPFCSSIFVWVCV